MEKGPLLLLQNISRKQFDKGKETLFIYFLIEV